MLFFGKVRIDLEKLTELGQKLAANELDTNFIVHTYCLKDDPTVGLNIWQANSINDLNKKLESHKPYYREISDITPVITPEQSQEVLLKQMTT
jgi:hypothetical protein